MTDNKRTIERYIDGFNRHDHAQILSCLTDDVAWAFPGGFAVVGKEAFDRVIEHDAFVGSPCPGRQVDPCVRLACRLRECRDERWTGCSGSPGGGPGQRKSARVISSGWPGGHSTSSRR